MAGNEKHVADASPSKELFIDMLTRDISISECILDLIDNSIHSLASEMDVMDHVIKGTPVPKIKNKIDIHFSPSEFTLLDNCGGITLKDAESQVFLLGRPTYEATQTGLGLYGIGMKRAFFKIGKKILVRSKTTEEEFEVPIDVPAWKSQPKVWNFPIVKVKKREAKQGSFFLKVDDLNPATKQQFGMLPFKKILIDKVALAYALFIDAGLEIKVNGSLVRSELPPVGESDKISVARRSWKSDGVDICIVAGTTPKKFGKPGGWYVFCNGRMVLEADKTERTGWGVAQTPTFHASFNRFIGYVYFRSKDLWKLPWTTTKEGVVLESPIYQETLAEMQIIARPILKFFRTLYGEDREESEPERDALNETVPVSPKDVASRRNSNFEPKIKKKRDDELVNILYKRPLGKVKQIGEALGHPGMSAVQVGERTFDDFYERNC